MEREERIRELADAVSHGEKTIGDVLDEAWDMGSRDASDRAFAFVKGRTPESEREELAIDYIRAMSLKGD